MRITINEQLYFIIFQIGIDAFDRINKSISQTKINALSESYSDYDSYRLYI